MGQFPNILCKVFALFGVRHIAYDMKIGRNFVGEIEWDLSCTVSAETFQLNLATLRPKRVFSF